MVTEKRATAVTTVFMVRNIGSGPEVAIQTRNIVTEGYDPEGKDKIEVGPGEPVNTHTMQLLELSKKNGECRCPKTTSCTFMAVMREMNRTDALL